MLWITVTSYIVVFHGCAGAGNTTTTEPSIAMVVELLSDQNQLKLAQYNENSVTPQGYEHFNPAMLENVSVSGRRWDRTAYYLRGYNHEAYLVNRMCYVIQTSWRRGKQDMLNYYKMRDLYVGTRDYEIGYVTHVVISKYMDTLEVFDIVRHRFLGGGEENEYAPPQLMFYIYINILENTRSIIALCNMLHEVKKKYKYAVGDTPWDQVLVDRKPKGPGLQKPGAPTGESQQVEESAISQREYLERLEKERRKKEKAAHKRHKEMMKFKNKYISTTTNATRPVRYWKKHGGNYDYGWSIENGAW